MFITCSRLSPCFSGVYSTIDAPFGARIPASTFAEHTPEVLLWAEGSDLLFDDTFPHFVVNDAREPRVVLPHPATHDKRARSIAGGNECMKALLAASLGRNTFSERTNSSDALFVLDFPTFSHIIFRG